ncbi:MAG: hypothetical protein GY821_16790 [Gammaproteobacteria bacterium]|nr:hypothetical protein [Gammaproteobacteria bacterium]
MLNAKKYGDLPKPEILKNAKKSNFGPLLLVADWPTAVETLFLHKLPTGTTTYPNGVEIEGLLRKLWKEQTRP